MKHTIWSANINWADWEPEREEICEEAGIDSKNDQAFEDYVYDLNNEYFEDECTNCKVDTVNTLLIFADDGLWNGRRCGVIDWEGTNIKDAFLAIRNRAADYNGDFEIAVEDGELTATIWHHDGTNYYKIREVKAEVDMEDFEDMTTAEILNATVPAGHYCQEVYGWQD